MISRLLLALALFVAPLAEASATILFAGGEDVDVTFVGAVGITTTSTQFRSGYGRAALTASATGSAADPPAIRFQTPVFANQSTIWLHAENITSNAAIVSNTQLVRIIGSDGNPAVLIRGTATNGQVKVSTRTTAGVLADLVTCTSGAWPLTSLTKFDIALTYAVAGSVTVYANGVQICTFSGDVTTNSRTLVNQVEFASTSVNGATTAWSEIIVATTDTRNMNLVTLAPVASGNTMAWTGVVGSVNPTTINDANFINTGSSAQVAEFTTGTLPAGTAWNVLGIKQVARALKGATGPATFDYIFRPSSGSTDYAECAGSTLTTSFANNTCYYTTYNSGVAILASDLGTGLNFGIKSQP